MKHSKVEGCAPLPFLKSGGATAPLSPFSYVLPLSGAGYSPTTFPEWMKWSSTAQQNCADQWLSHWWWTVRWVKSSNYMNKIISSLRSSLHWQISTTDRHPPAHARVKVGKASESFAAHVILSPTASFSFCRPCLALQHTHCIDHRQCRRHCLCMIFILVVVQIILPFSYYPQSVW